MASHESSNLMLKHPFTAQICGGTGVGKTELAFNLIKYANEIIEPKCDLIYYCYGEFQQRFLDFPEVVFHKGFDSSIISHENLQGRSLLLILDDILDSIDPMELLKLYQMYSHHRSISPILIVQNLFSKSCKVLCDCSINTQYLFQMKSPRDKTCVRSLQVQLEPSNSRFFNEIFNEATSEPYSFLLIDCKPSTPDHLKYRSHIFPNQRMCVYTSKK